MRCCVEDEGFVALRRRPAGGGAKPPHAAFYAQTCGWTLARAHARSGDPVATAACLGDSDAFDRSVTDFSQRYADQNERDYRSSSRRSDPDGWKRARVSDDWGEDLMRAAGRSRQEGGSIGS